MSNHIMAICDREEVYAHRFLEYVKDRKILPFQIQVFTEVAQLAIFCQKQAIELLLIAESCYVNEVSSMSVRHMIILTESGELTVEKAQMIRKYQSCEIILKEILLFYSNLGAAGQILMQQTQSAKLISVYTPIRRCLQTSYAVALGQILSEHSKVLYLNFEAYSGFGKFMGKEFKMDLTDLMYFFHNLEDKFIPRFTETIQHIEGLDYIPPAMSFVDLASITMEDWKRLLEQIIRECNYSYIILDLSDNIQGLFELLKMSERIYTIIREDGMSVGKMEQYELLLQMMECEEVLAKTKRFKLPTFKHVPCAVAELPYCELTRYVRSIVKEDGYEI
ncbi:MAG: hypothetical protein RRX92_01325 [Lachnospiraceae bacterium]